MRPGGTASFAVIMSVAKNLSVRTGAGAPRAEILRPRLRGLRMTTGGTRSVASCRCWPCVATTPVRARRRT